MGLLLYPYFLVVFWYHDFLPKTAKKAYGSFIYAADLLSVALLLRTFFQPLKGEYREGLVAFSIIMGIIVKTLILLADIFMLSILSLVLIGIFLIVAALPLLLILFAI